MPEFLVKFLCFFGFVLFLNQEKNLPSNYFKDYLLYFIFFVFLIPTQSQFINLLNINILTY